MTNSTNNKYIKYFFTTVLMLLLGSQLQTAQAQDDDPSITAGLDLVSTYVWRGTSYSGPAIQPYVEVAAGGFTLGAWGSQPFNGEGQEMDLYAGYSFDFGLSIGLTDYYYPPAEFFDGDVHALELNAGYTVGDLSLSGNYIFAGEGSYGDDVYFELAYAIENTSLFVGGGDGWHLADPTDGFNVVNVGVSTSKEVAITDEFSLPVFGTVILNPEREVFYVLAGLSL